MLRHPLLAILLFLTACGQSRPETVVVIVLDTVRADHTSVCGYPRPTTPALVALRDERGAKVACHAYSDAPWTLPSHGSLFTGLPTPDHGLHFPPAGTRARDRLWALDKDVPTLAEQMRARGYQTVFVSGNPIIRPSTGLQRGFDRVALARRFGDLSGSAMLVRLRDELTREDRDQPLFLFVNIADAHQPWSGTPKGLGWVPPRKGLAFHSRKPGDIRQKYMKGHLEPKKMKQIAEHNIDVYDYGVSKDDATVLGVLGVIEQERGFPDRLAVTSDHGEYLGDHGFVGHGGTVFDSVTRVPLLALGRGAGGLPDGPFAIRSVHDWVLTGHWPSPAQPVAAVAYASPSWRRFFHSPWGRITQVAMWSGTDKVRWTSDGKVVRFDLAKDPKEKQPLPADDDPLVPALRDLAAKTGKEPPPGHGTGLELQKLGYVE